MDQKTRNTGRTTLAEIVQVLDKRWGELAPAVNSPHSDYSEMARMKMLEVDEITNRVIGFFLGKGD